MYLSERTEVDPMLHAIEQVTSTMTGPLPTSFRAHAAEVLSKSTEPGVQFGTTYPLALAVHVGGMVDAKVKSNAAYLEVSKNQKAIGRRVAGLLYSIEAPRTPDDPMRFHFVESTTWHSVMRRAMGMTMPSQAVTDLPLQGNAKTTLGVVYYADRKPKDARIQTFISSDQGAEHTTVDLQTAKCVTAAVVNAIGPHLLNRLPDAPEITSYLTLGDESGVQSISRHQIERGVTPDDIDVRF